MVKNQYKYEIIRAMIQAKGVIVMDYLYVMLATVLLAVEFALSKKYQALEGVSAIVGLRFNALSGFLSAVVVWGFSGFRLEWSVFSFVLALGLALCGISYSMIGFRILKKGSLALYSTFLMSGGMLLPYLFGIVFLHEKLTLLRMFGMLFVLAAVILSNFSKQKTDRKQLFLCFAVFVLNGLVSTISKCHQIGSAYGAISSSGFVMYSGIGKCVCSLLAMLLYHKRGSPPATMDTLSFSVTAGAAAVGAASYFLQLIGAKNLPASVLYPMVTGGSILFSTITGKAFFREAISPHQRFSIVLCIIGTLLFL